MNTYVIYDNLYEEYQQPFTMKNDNIARIEFEQFTNKMVNDAPDKEKAKTRNRFLLCKFDGLFYNREIGAFCIESPTAGKMYEIHANPVAIGDDDE